MIVIRDTLFICFLFLSVDGAIVRQRRDAFNPDRLMEHHMDMRTEDQAMFGSYHPNDLVQEIVDYFKKGDQGNQWGLFVYNPNQAISQYNSYLTSAGTLGPEMAGDSNNGHVERSHGQTMTVPFDPNNLNEQLIKSFHNNEFDKYQIAEPQGQGQVKGQTNMLFDPDILNKHLMQQLLNKHSNEMTVTSEKANATSSGKEDNKQSTVNELSSQNKDIVYNPTALNAGLFNGMRYDLNSINEGIPAIPIFQTSTGMGGNNTPTVPTIPVPTTKESDNGKGSGQPSNVSKESETGANMLDGANGNTGIGGAAPMSTARPGLDKGSEGNGEGFVNHPSGFAGNVFSMTSVANGHTMFVGQGSKPYDSNFNKTIQEFLLQAHGNNQMSPSANGENTGTTMPIGYQTGAIGSGNYGETKPETLTDNNAGTGTGNAVPPGVSVNGDLKQTDANNVDVHGIGSLG